MIDISVVIPTYREPAQQLRTNIGYMKEQTAFKKGKMEIILADYYEYDNEKNDNMMYFRLLKSKNIKLVDVDRRGIAYGRHAGIMASSGKVIVCFDADGYITPNDGVERLAKPILDGDAVLTCCDNVLDIRPLTVEQVQSINMVSQLNYQLSLAQRAPMFGFLEPGMTFSKEAYMRVGGFSDVTQYEGSFLAAKLIMSYTPAMKKWIEGVTAVVSARRALASVKHGLYGAFGDYNNAFR